MKKAYIFKHAINRDIQLVSLMNLKKKQRKMTLRKRFQSLHDIMWIQLPL